MKWNSKFDIKNAIAVQDGKHLFVDHEIDLHFLKSKNLLKTLSLYLAFKAGIKIPSTLLIIGNEFNSLEDFGYRWNWPLMIRMDFEKLPRKKTLGGIPVKSLLIAKSICGFLQEQRCLPLFHPHLDRFKDIYSCGVLMTMESSEVVIEVVGKGFDAGDLRLGKITPHETISVNLLDNRKQSVSLVNSNLYNDQRAQRIDRIDAFMKYIEYANNYGKLISSLESDLLNRSNRNLNIGKKIPKSYLKLPDDQLKKLRNICSILHSHVLPELPYSNSFVASFSLIPSKGWVLWDIYGGWYSR